MSALSPVKLAGRCANGFERDTGSIIHAMPAEQAEQCERNSAMYPALCGRKPGRRSAGWQTMNGHQISCPRCSRLAR